MWESLQTWLEHNQSMVGWALGVSAFTFIGTLIAVPIAVIQMPDNYFVRSSEPRLPRKPLQIARHVAKNILGVVLFIMGIAMLFLPGQGLLTMLLGISLIDFPGKRPLQLRLLRLNAIRRSVDWMRHKANKPPLEIPEKE